MEQLFEHFFLESWVLGFGVPAGPLPGIIWGPGVLSLLQARSPNPQTVLRFQVQIPGFRILSQVPHAGLSIKQ